MKANGLFVITCLVFIFAAWVATGGPTRPIATAGPFLTPVTRPGETPQGYRSIVPVNPLDPGSYPTQVGGAPSTISSGPDPVRTGSDTRTNVYIERSTVGPASGNPNQEYITLINGGDSDVDIRDWRIESAATGERIYAGLHRLPRGDTFHIVSGREAADHTFFASLCDAPGTDCAFLNRNLELWGRSHETITLYDQDGQLVDSFSY